jgi:hypothetical protein
VFLLTVKAVGNAQCTQDASYALDADHNVVVGLPPPKEGNWFRVRNYGLTESLLGIALKVGGPAYQDLLFRHSPVELSDGTQPRENHECLPPRERRL